MARVLGNCAKMHIPPREAKALTWWEYQALVWEHQPEDAEEEVEAPSVDFVARRQERLEALGIAKVLH